MWGESSPLLYPHIPPPQEGGMPAMPTLVRHRETATPPLQAFLPPLCRNEFKKQTLNETVAPQITFNNMFSQSYLYRSEGGGMS